MIRSLKQIIEDAVFEALERHNWNKQLAADDLGISLKSIYNHIHRMDERLSETKPATPLEATAEK